MIFLMTYLGYICFLVGEIHLYLYCIPNYFQTRSLLTGILLKTVKNITTQIQFDLIKIQFNILLEYDII